MIKTHAAMVEALKNCLSALISQRQAFEVDFYDNAHVPGAVARILRHAMFTESGDSERRKRTTVGAFPGPYFSVGAFRTRA